MKKNFIAAGFLMVIALGIFAIQTLRDRSISAFGKVWLALVAISLASLILLLTIHFAHARDLYVFCCVQPGGV